MLKHIALKAFTLIDTLAGVSNRYANHLNEDVLNLAIAMRFVFTIPVTIAYDVI